MLYAIATTVIFFIILGF